MIKISSKSQYGLRALSYLAAQDSLVSIAEIAENEKIPFEFLEKIVQALKKAGILVSERGARGGYALARTPDAISLREIFEAFDDMNPPVKCLEDDNSCLVGASCASRTVWMRVYNAAVKELDSLSLAEISQGVQSASFIQSNDTISCSR